MNLSTALICTLALSLPTASAWALDPLPDNLDGPGVLAYGYDATPGADGVANLSVDRRAAGTAHVNGASGTGNYWAQATMTEGLNLPQLRLYAEANGNPARTYTDAVAAAWQHFDYAGSTAMSYTLQLTFDGTWAGTNGGSSAWLAAGLGTLDTDGQTVMDWDLVPSLSLQAGPDASAKTFTLTDQMSFTLTPGGSLELHSVLAASAIPGLHGWSIQDVSHTYSVQFLVGDTRLLVPTVTAVPEPGTWALALSGLLLVGHLSRRACASGPL